MLYRHIRNATALLTIGEHRVLIDPMRSEVGAMPGLRFFNGERRKNPLVQLPSGAEEAFTSATSVLISHEHPDHLDKPAVAWIRERGLRVYGADIDVGHLRRRGLDARAIDGEAFGAPVEVVPGRHGRGVLGWLMGPVSGFHLAHPDEPSVYLTGDTVLTDPVRDAVKRLRPDVLVAPAGAANFGRGGDILFSIDELIELAGLFDGGIVLNHLEVMDHCPTTRAGVRERFEAAGLGDRVEIPEDGEELVFDRSSDAAHSPTGAVAARRPGFQKWLTSKFA